MPTFAGVDVGGRRKGFDVALIDVDWGLHRDMYGELPNGRAARLIAVRRFADAEQAAAWLAERAPRLVAVDSPRHAAPPGARSRLDERELAARICGIRYTPDGRTLEAPHKSGYYEWINNGLGLYAALEKAGLPLIECFPTATWTRLHGPRGTRSRREWSREALSTVGIDGLPPRLSQDARDAIGAALTARLHAEGRTESCGEIVVPA
jgi:predicted nuclease with RNAse H fold